LVLDVMRGQAMRACVRETIIGDLGLSASLKPFMYKTQIPHNLVCPRPLLHYFLEIFTTPVSRHHPPTLFLS
jgi:hypothetical protein